MFAENEAYNERTDVLRDRVYAESHCSGSSIGGVPLAMGLSCGNIVLTVAVTAILITAPLGAFLIEATYKKWLGRQTEILSR